MAERRMFSKSVTFSARFLRMPPTARLLYYDLGMQADDDGIVEAFTVMRTTGAADDDLRVLVTKGFIEILDQEDLISYITAWKQNNHIRIDRKRNSIYKHLLTGVLNDGQLADKRLTDVRQNDGQLADTCLTQDSIGEFRPDEVSLLEDKTDKTKRDYFSTGEDNENFALSSTERQNVVSIMCYLNSHASTDFKTNIIETQKLIVNHLRKGHTVKHFEKVIDEKCSQWLGNSKMEMYLRPQTLFGDKFEAYLDEAEARTKNTGFYKGDSDSLDDLF